MNAYKSKLTNIFNFLDSSKLYRWLLVKKKQNLYFKAVNKSIMVAQKSKKKNWQKLFLYLNAYYSKTHQIKALNSLDESISNERLSQNPKTGGFRELILPGNDFKTCSAVNYPKKFRFWRPGNQPKKWNSKPNQSRLSTLLILPYHMEAY